MTCPSEGDPLWVTFYGRWLDFLREMTWPSMGDHVTLYRRWLDPQWGMIRPSIADDLPSLGDDLTLYVRCLDLLWAMTWPCLGFDSTLYGWPFMDDDLTLYGIDHVWEMTWPPIKHDLTLSLERSPSPICGFPDFRSSRILLHSLWIPRISGKSFRETRTSGNSEISDSEISRFSLTNITGRFGSAIPSFCFFREIQRCWVLFSKREWTPKSLDFVEKPKWGPLQIRDSPYFKGTSGNFRIREFRISRKLFRKSAESRHSGRVFGK